jgi:hypothetical protein
MRRDETQPKPNLETTTFSTTLVSTRVRRRGVRRDERVGDGKYGFIVTIENHPRKRKRRAR